MNFKRLSYPNILLILLPIHYFHIIITITLMTYTLPPFYSLTDLQATHKLF